MCRLANDHGETHRIDHYGRGVTPKLDKTAPLRYRKDHETWLSLPPSAAG